MPLRDSNRAELKSNRAQLKSDRAGTDLPFAITFGNKMHIVNCNGSMQSAWPHKSRKQRKPLSVLCCMLCEHCLMVAGQTCSSIFHFFNSSLPTAVRTVKKNRNRSLVSVIAFHAIARAKRKCFSLSRIREMVHNPTIPQTHTFFCGVVRKKGAKSG